MRRVVSGSKIGVAFPNPEDLAKFLLIHWTDDSRPDPLIEEVQVEGSSKIRLYVVWEEWKSYSKPERDAIVYAALDIARVEREGKPDLYPEVPDLRLVAHFEGLIPEEARTLGIELPASA